MASCCSETFCQVCITPIIEDKKPCPLCQSAEFSMIFNIKYHRRILALEVRCTMKDRGCEWTGKLEGLKAHLDVNTGDCEYVDIACSNKCDQPVEKHNLNTHLTNSCPKREFTCQYCNFKATYEVVTNDHWPQCSFYPVPCPNACGIQAIERGDIDAHLLQCPLEEVECDFGHAGCNTKLPRQDLERHMEESTQKHLVLMSVSLKLSKEQQEKSQQELQQNFKRNLEKRDRQITKLQEQLQAETEVKISDLQQQLQQKSQQVETLERCMGGVVCSPTIKMPDFKQYKDENTCWFSPPLYTHYGGYKFCTKVWARGGWRRDKLTVLLCSMKGEFDRQLQWPAKCTITLQLLNQERDQDHVTVTETPTGWKRPTTEGHCDTIKIYHCIAHKDLEYDAQKQTCYLKNDCLVFRVAKVELN